MRQQKQLVASFLRSRSQLLLSTLISNTQIWNLRWPWRSWPWETSPFLGTPDVTDIDLCHVSTPLSSSQGDINRWRLDPPRLLLATRCPLVQAFVAHAHEQTAAVKFMQTNLGLLQTLWLLPHSMSLFQAQCVFYSSSTAQRVVSWGTDALLKRWMQQVGLFSVICWKGH